LLLQLNAELPEKLPGHERNIYLFACRKKACRRKDGSVRGIRTTRITKTSTTSQTAKTAEKETREAKPKPRSDIGESLFGVQSSKSPPAANVFAAPGSQTTNPFSKPGSSQANPFASTSSLAAKPAQKSDIAADLPQTFADKARIAASNDPKPQPPTVSETWPEQSAFPEPFPAYYIEADKEYLDSSPQDVPQAVRITDLETEAGNEPEDKSAFESTMDKAFQKFADRLAQNPEQVLRYDHGGQPLLYSKKDAVGKVWPRLPRCGKCGAERVFELQLTPHAITELEADDMSLDGMDWGTIILAVCGNDCAGSNEEWLGVQWEELAAKR
jgi:pre-rRNA-processing protein TSR4